MIPASSFAGCDVAVFGLARSGLASVASLKAGGAEVVAWDDKDDARAAAERAGAVIAPPADWRWGEIKALVLSPGVPLTHPAPHPVVLRAREAGVEILGDVELFAREMRSLSALGSRAPIVAVTGTNGKSTTTALIGHILASCGFAPEIGGNIGRPVLDLAQPNGRTVYVLEMSSYQIDLAPGLSPDVSVLTNIAPDHLERHGSMENYAAVKARLIAQTIADGHVVVGVDDSYSAAIFTRAVAQGAAEAVAVSVGKVLGRGIFAVDGVLYDAWGSRAARIMDLSTATRLRGVHNWQNAGLAYGAVRPLTKDARSIAAAIANFPGLAHRTEDVGRIGKVAFVNDSKATNADAAARALACYSDIYWIAGGKPKTDGIASLAPYFPRIRKAYLIGEAAERFARTLDGHVPYGIADTLEKAAAEAFADARASAHAAPVVLLSPACASFDQFRDFEARGDAFRAIVGGFAQSPVREAS